MACLYRYELVAVVHYASFHYITYIRREGKNNWENHNDMSDKIKLVNSDYRCGTTRTVICSQINFSMY